MPGSLEDTPLTYIDSLEQLQELQQKLMNVKEFAVDLEVGRTENCFYMSLPLSFPSLPPLIPPSAPLLPSPHPGSSLSL